MNAESKDIRKTLDKQLAVLIDSFGATGNDAKKLANIQDSIVRLLEKKGDAEKHIRQSLDEHLESGHLRKETYQLISSILDRYVAEDVPTSPGNITYDPKRPPILNKTGKDVPASSGFSSTTVLAKDSFQAESADDQVQVGSLLRDRFLLQKRVSGGSMGVVYKALDRRLAEVGTVNPFVAIKVLSPQLSKSGAAFRALQQEAAKGRCLTHPGIVRFIDLDRENDVYFIVMEWLEGRTLADILDSADGKNIELSQSLDIVRHIGRALDYAHRCGIVHADVKPGNVMMLPDGSVKLFDFGIARVRQTQEQNKRDFDPSVLGALTPAYSSMQVLTGEEPVPSDDVFSLACLFYRLAAGHRVFGPRNAAEAAEAGMKPQRVAGLSDQQWSALNKSLSYSRVTRYGTMSEFMQELDAATTDSVVIEPGDGLVPHESGGRTFWLIGLAGLLTLFVVAGYRFGVFNEARNWLYEQDLRGSLETFWSNGPEEDAIGSAAGDTETPGASTDSMTDAAPADQALQGTDITDKSLAEEAHSDAAESEAVPPLIDYSLLPAADVDISLIETANDSDPVMMTMRENGKPVVVDLLRTGRLDSPLELRVEEIGYSGNRSPWAARQYTMSTDSVFTIPAGQDRARITFSMTDDARREADQLSSLRIRQSESTRTQLAAVDVVLEDDDRRRFEAGLPINTIAFALSQVTVRERDPAVQIDVLRFNPDDQPIVIGYSVRALTATENEDYFPPNGYSISFGPLQRSARLLIPLVQDSLTEGDETFTVELATLDPSVPNNVFQRVIVMIRDDEIAGP